MDKQELRPGTARFVGQLVMSDERELNVFAANLWAISQIVQESPRSVVKMRFYDKQNKKVMLWARNPEANGRFDITATFKSERPDWSKS